MAGLGPEAMGLRDRGMAAWIGAGLLVLTALFHLSGFTAIPASDEAGFFDLAMRPLWLFAGAHWLLLAVIGLMPVGRGVRLAIAAALLLDAALLTWFLGPFIGAATLAASGAAFAVNGLRADRQVTAPSE